MIDCVMVSNLTTLTERGQVSMPAALRKKLGIRPGQSLMWKMISDTECRVVIVRKPVDRRGHSVRGCMKRFQTGMPATTSGWMDLLREGDRE